MGSCYLCFLCGEFVALFWCFWAVCFDLVFGLVGSVVWNLRVVVFGVWGVLSAPTDLRLLLFVMSAVHVFACLLVDVREPDVQGVLLVGFGLGICWAVEVCRNCCRLHMNYLLWS